MKQTKNKNWELSTDPEVRHYQLSQAAFSLSCQLCYTPSYSIVSVIENQFPLNF